MRSVELVSAWMFQCRAICRLLVVCVTLLLGVVGVAEVSAENPVCLQVMGELNPDGTLKGGSSDPDYCELVMHRNALLQAYRAQSETIDQCKDALGTFARAGIQTTAEKLDCVSKCAQCEQKARAKGKGRKVRKTRAVLENNARKAKTAPKLSR